MTGRGFNYGLLMQRALRRVMSEVLGQAAEKGLPGDHHFFITFSTRHPGVDIPASLRSRFPKEMTIVIQHEYWDLAVTGERFSVSLSFSGRPENLVIPFDAIRTFVDPSVEFGLKFDAIDEPDEPDPPLPEPGAEEAAGAVVRLDKFRRT